MPRSQVLRVMVATVEAQFVQRIKQKKAEARDTRGQSEYVDEGKDLLFGDVSPSNEELAFELREGLYPLTSP